jgi:hypothetical protein
MRLQLKLAAAVTSGFILLPSPARADWSGGVDARTALYQDTDRTTISTTVVNARVSPRDVVTFSGHYLADIITSASIDVVTAATTRPAVPFHETRHEGAGGFVYADGTRTVTVGYVYSVEHDWRSHTVSAGYANDFVNHQLSLGVSGSFTTNDVGRADDPNFHRALRQGSFSLDAGIVGTKRDLVTIDYTFMVLKGYQASPYRFVFFSDPSAPGQLVGNPEQDPDTRIRHAGTVRWNHHAFKDTAVKSHLRGYLDGWGVVSVTAGTEVVVGFGELELGAFVRGYAQKHATFYQDVYDTRRLYMTADRELSSFIDAFGGLRGGWQRTRRLGVFEDLHAELKATGFAFKFLDFARLPQREGVIGELALGGSI